MRKFIHIAEAMAAPALEEHQPKEFSQAFWSWFRDSRVVDENGDPMVVHHWTFEDFTVFDRMAILKRLKRNPEGTDRIGHWFSSNPDAIYAGPSLGGKRMDCYLSLQNPLFIDEAPGDEAFYELSAFVKREGGATKTRELLKSLNYDGIIMMRTNLDGYKQHVYIALDSNQIKSATNNNGVYNRKSDDITEDASTVIKPIDTPAFRNWFGRSKVTDQAGKPLVLYHGTGADVSEFKGMVWGSVGTDLPNEYAAMRQEWYKGSANVMPIYMRIEQPFDADALPDAVRIEDFIQEMVKQAKAAGHSLSDAQIEHIDVLEQIMIDGRYREESGPHYDAHDFWVDASSLFGRDGRDAFREIFSMLGFDGIRMTEHGELTFGVLSPDQVKSAIGNNGSFGDGANISEAALMELDKQAVNAAGRVIGRSPEAIRAFWTWFGKSKVKDRNGRPIPVFHGTSGDFRSFDPAMSNSNTKTGAPHGSIFFTDSQDVANTYTVARNDGGKKFAKKEWADEFYDLVKNGTFDQQMEFLATHEQVPDIDYKDGGNVIPAYLRINRPLRVNADGAHWDDIYFQPKGYRVPESFTTNEIAAIAQEQGYDGAIIKNVKDSHKGSTGASTIYIVFSPNQVKSALSNSGSFDGSKPEIDEGDETK